MLIFHIQKPSLAVTLALKISFCKELRNIIHVWFQTFENQKKTRYLKEFISKCYSKSKSLKIIKISDALWLLVLAAGLGHARRCLYCLLLGPAPGPALPLVTRGHDVTESWHPGQSEVRSGEVRMTHLGLFGLGDTGLGWHTPPITLQPPPWLPWDELRLRLTERETQAEIVAS